MTSLEKWLTVATSSVVAVTVLARRMKALIKVLNFLVDLPSSHAALATATEANTAAIRTLTEQLAQLTVAEQRPPAP